MRRSTAKLRVVPKLDTVPIELEPEQEFPALFAEEAALVAQLAAVRRRIGLNRERYRARHGLLMLPSYDRLKQLFGAQTVRGDGRAPNTATQIAGEEVGQ